MKSSIFNLRIMQMVSFRRIPNLILIKQLRLTMCNKGRDWRLVMGSLKINLNLSQKRLKLHKKADLKVQACGSHTPDSMKVTKISQILSNPCWDKEASLLVQLFKNKWHWEIVGHLESSGCWAQTVNSKLTEIHNSRKPWIHWEYIDQPPAGEPEILSQKTPHSNADGEE